MQADEPAVGAAARTRLSARCVEARGIDLIVVYNAGRHRMSDRKSLAESLPCGSAHHFVKELATEVYTAVKHTPVIRGVCAADPHLLANHYQRESRPLAIVVDQYLRTLGLIGGSFRTTLEETGMTFRLETDCIHAAHEVGLLITAYAFDVEKSRGLSVADIIVAHPERLPTVVAIANQSNRSVELELNPTGLMQVRPARSRAPPHIKADQPISAG